MSPEPSILHPWFPDLDVWCKEHFLTRPGYVSNTGRPLDPGISMLVATVGPERVVFIASFSAGRSPRTDLDQLSRRIHQEFTRLAPTPNVTISLGPAFEDVRGLRGSLREAEQVAEVAVHLTDGKHYYELRDVSVEGFLLSLRDDPRLQALIERELGPLLRTHPEDDAHLLETLRVYLQCGQNKSVAAETLGISRPTMYHRLAAAADLLGVDIASLGSGLSTYLALRALDVTREAFWEE